MEHTDSNIHTENITPEQSSRASYNIMSNPASCVNYQPSGGVAGSTHSDNIRINERTKSRSPAGGDKDWAAPAKTPAKAHAKTSAKKPMASAMAPAKAHAKTSAKRPMALAKAPAKAHAKTSAKRPMASAKTPAKGPARVSGKDKKCQRNSKASAKTRVKRASAEEDWWALTMDPRPLRLLNDVFAELSVGEALTLNQHERLASSITDLNAQDARRRSQR